MAQELVVHHCYTSGSAADLSGYANHGYPSSAEVLPAADGGLVLDGRSSRVVAFPSASLTDLRSLRVRARVTVDELGDRRTVAEGYLAFSFSVEPDASLAGAVYTGARWHGVRSAPGTVPTERWVDVAFSYDGQDTLSLAVDGRLVGTRFAPIGAVDSIHWPYGLNIGAWPDQDLRVFSGRMAKLWLWRQVR